MKPKPLQVEKAKREIDGLPTGDICFALDDRGDNLSLWAADVIRNLRKEAHEAKIGKRKKRRTK